MKKILAVLASISITACMFTSCGNVDETVSDEPSAEETTAVTSAPTAKETTTAESAETSAAETTTVEETATTTPKPATTTTVTTTTTAATTTEKPAVTTTTTTASSVSKTAAVQTTTTTKASDKPTDTPATKPATTTTKKTTTTTKKPADNIPKGYTGKSGIYWRTREETIASWPSGWESDVSNMNRMQSIANSSKYESVLDYNMRWYTDNWSADYYRNIGRNLSHDGTDYGKAMAVYNYTRENFDFVNCIYHTSMTYALCEGIGLEVAMASSLDGGSGFTDDFYVSHIANAVYVDGAWYILDPTLAAKYHNDEGVLENNDFGFKRFIDKYENELKITISKKNYK